MNRASTDHLLHTVCIALLLNVHIIVCYPHFTKEGVENKTKQKKQRREWKLREVPLFSMATHKWRSEGLNPCLSFEGSCSLEHRASLSSPWPAS